MSLLTNASAQTALATLRNVQGNLQETQARISTGLKVRSPKENPAFFLVAQTVRGDLTVLNGLKENLTIGVNAAKTASSGIDGITNFINQIQESLTTAESGTALNEVQFAINEIVGQIEGQVDGTNFNGVNLLKGTDTTTVTTTVIREEGAFKLQSFTLKSQNLDDLSIAGLDAAAAATDTVFTARADAETAFEDLYRAFNAGMASRLDGNKDGQVDLSSTGPDDVILAEGIARPDPFAGNDFFSFYGNQADVDFLQSIGLTAASLGTSTQDASKEIIVLDLDTAPVGATAGTAINYSAAKASAAAGTFAAADLDFADVATYVEEVVLSDGQLRAFADDSGFRTVAREIEVADIGTRNVQSGFVLADSLISRVNIAQTVIGVFEGTLSSRQDFLENLTDSLELGVAALVEADLDEESSRLQSLQVQEQLATQALQIANQRPQNILSLFR